MNGQHQILGADKLQDIQELKPESSGAIKLTPETKVLCIHRGRRELVDGRPVPINRRTPPPGYEQGDYSAGGYVGDLVDMFDSLHYCIKPGYFTIEYGAAKHFQARAVVPGSRNPELGSQVSFIAIIGATTPTAHGPKVSQPVDEIEQWDPFTDEECRTYGMAVEALDRANMTDPIDPQVDIVPTFGQANENAKLQASRVTSSGAAPARTRKATSIEGTGKSALANRNAAGTNEAIEQGRRDAAAQANGEA